MKKLLAIMICVAAMFTSNVSAQKAGDMYIGGNIGLQLSSTSLSSGGSYTSLGFEIEPEYSYFIIDNLRIGAGLSYSISDAHYFSVMPRVAYYIEMIENLYYTPEVAIGGGFVATEGLALGLFSMNFNLFALEYRPTQNIGISMSLINLSYDLAAYEGASAGSLNFNILSSPKVGIRYYF